MASCILRSTKTISINRSVARPKYEIYVVKRRKEMDFFKLSPGAKSVP